MLKDVKKQQPDKKQQEKKTETLSDRDLRDLMGIGRQRLARAKGGAYRQR